MLFWILVSVTIVCFRAHWFKATPLKSVATYSVLESRELFNGHNLSALVYLAGAAYAAVHDQVDMAMICVGTFLSCSAYHLSHESMFFNLDFLFASASGFIFLWTLYLAAPLGDWNTHLYVDCCTPDIMYTQYGILAIPLGLLLFIGCGLPAEISEMKAQSVEKAGGSTSPYLQLCTHCRGDSAIYNWVHPLWHLLSGAAPLLCVHFFAHQCDTSPQFHNYTMGVAPIQFGVVTVPTVPLCSLATALALNLLGNAIGIMPIQ